MSNGTCSACGRPTITPVGNQNVDWPRMLNGHYCENPMDTEKKLEDLVIKMETLLDMLKGRRATGFNILGAERYLEDALKPYKKRSDDGKDHN